TDEGEPSSIPFRGNFPACSLRGRCYLLHWNTFLKLMEPVEYDLDLRRCGGGRLILVCTRKPPEMFSIPPNVEIPHRGPTNKWPTRHRHRLAEGEIGTRRDVDDRG